MGWSRTGTLDKWDEKTGTVDEMISNKVCETKKCFQGLVAGREGKGRRNGLHY